MLIAIDLHVKCPFYKKWNNKETPFFLLYFHTVLGSKSQIQFEIFTLYLGSKQLYSTKFLSHGAVKNFKMSSIYKGEIWLTTSFHCTAVATNCFCQNTFLDPLEMKWMYFNI